MSESLAEMIVHGAAVYLGVGVVVALAFVAFGVGRIDAAARGASPFFRPMVFSGCVLLWPYIVLRWLSMRRINEPEEGAS